MQARATAATTLLLGLLGLLGPPGSAWAKPPVLDPEMAEMAQALRDSCVADTGADVAVLEQVNAGAPLPADAALKCYIRCTMETSGMMSEGAVDPEAVIELLPEPLSTKAAATLRSCATQAGADDCDTAFRTQQCWQAGLQDDFFLI